MDDAAPMSGDECVGELDPEFDDAVGRECTFCFDRLVERSSIEQFADEEGTSVLLAGVMHRADVRMRDERGDARFAAEALEPAGLGQGLGTQELERDVSFETAVPGAIDFGRPVAPDSLEHFVVRDPQRRGHGRDVGVVSRAYSARAAASGSRSGSADFHRVKSSS